jgi:hypothetical protein
MVGRICAALDAEVETFRHRSLADERYPFRFSKAGAIVEGWPPGQLQEFRTSPEMGTSTT